MGKDKSGRDFDNNYKKATKRNKTPQWNEQRSNQCIMTS